MKDREPMGAMLNGFCTESLRHLRESVAKIVNRPEDADSCSEFVQLADAAFGLYLFLTHAWQTAEEGRDTLGYIAQNARLIASKLENLDRETASVLVQKLWLSSDRRGSIDISDLNAEIDRLNRLSAAASDLTRRRRPAKKANNRAASPEMADLIAGLANAYASRFNERPSSSRNGVFIKLLRVLFQATGIQPPGETRLGTILKKLKFEAAPVLKPGRKLRPASNTTNST